MEQLKKWIGLAVLLVVMFGGVAWALRGESVDPAVAALEAQREQVFSDNATEADRLVFREQVGALTEQQRRQLFERSRPAMQARLSEEMNRLFAMTPQQLQQEARRKAADVIAARKQRDQPGEDRRGPPGMGPGGPGGSEAQRDERRKQRLDFVDPNTRGQMSEFRRLVDAELKSQGQEPLSGRDRRAMMGARGGAGGRS